MAALEANFEDLVHSLVPLGSLSPQSRAEILGAAEVLRFARGESQDTRMIAIGARAPKLARRADAELRGAGM